jgi:parvulin-like peptidyl-prolyl isomerase
MTNLIRIDDEVISSDSFVNLLKLSGRFDSLIDDIVKEKLAVHSAKKLGIKVAPDEIQERADQWRRVNGLHRAVEMNRYLEGMHVSVDEYEKYISDMLYYEHMMDQVVTEEAVDKYFRANSPKFDSVDVSHIVVDSEGKAREIVAMLKEDPDRFGELAREFSIAADTPDHDGHVGRLPRGSFKNGIEAKVFHAQKGEILGPFVSADGSCWEIYSVHGKHSGALDDDTRSEIRRTLQEQWLSAQASEHRLQLL